MWLPAEARERSALDGVPARRADPAHHAGPDTRKNTAARGTGTARRGTPARARPELLPFSGPLPQVATGDIVWCRDALKRGWTRRVALDGPHYDQASAHRTCRLTVPTADLDDWYAQGAAAPSVNWPAEDVARADRPVPGPIMGSGRGSAAQVRS